MIKYMPSADTSIQLATNCNPQEFKLIVNESTTRNLTSKKLPLLDPSPSPGGREKGQGCQTRGTGTRSKITVANMHNLNWLIGRQQTHSVSSFSLGWR